MLDHTRRSLQLNVVIGLADRHLVRKLRTTKRTKSAATQNHLAWHVYPPTKHQTRAFAHKGFQHVNTSGTAAKCVNRYGTTLNRKSTNLAQPSRRSRWQTFCNPGETNRSERHGATNAARVMSNVLLFLGNETVAPP